MRKIIILFIAILVNFNLWGCQPTKPNKMLTPDSIVCKQLGTSLAQLLSSPSTVKCYAVRNVRQPSETDFAFTENFVLGELITKLSRQEVAILEFLIPSNEANYHVNPAKVKSPYMPRLAFEFAKGKKKAWLLVSLANMSWSIYYDGKTQFTYDYVERDVIERFCNYFIQQQAQKEKR
ncbi:MAG: hypothetical protein J5529_04890 [Prevotella sp.]|nr:hypothetical protein [Prevotella sp.]